MKHTLLAILLTIPHTAHASPDSTAMGAESMANTVANAVGLGSDDDDSGPGDDSDD